LQHPNHVVATEHTASDGPQPAFVDGRLDQPNVIIKPREEQELNPYGRSSSLYMSVRPRSWCVWPLLSESDALHHSSCTR